MPDSGKSNEIVYTPGDRAIIPRSIVFHPGWFRENGALEKKFVPSEYQMFNVYVSGFDVDHMRTAVSVLASVNVTWIPTS
jgi:hypothetical protein